MTTLAPSTFYGDKPVCFAQGRRGEVYIYQGYGKRGRVWSPSLNAFRPAGTDGPKLLPTEADRKPTITVANFVHYYVARVDITDIGGGYIEPPSITIGSTNFLWDAILAPGAPTYAGPYTEAATATARIRQGYVSAIQMRKYGKGYTETPTISISSPRGVLTGTTEITPADISASQNNYNPGVGDIYNLTATAAVDLTGWVGPGADKNILVRNKGNFPITLKYLSGLSSAGNKFSTMDAADVVLPPKKEVSICYDLSHGLWYVRNVMNQSSSSSGPQQAQALAIVRAHLRGTYQCYFRYVNDAVPESEGGPLYSDLSEVNEVDCGDGAAYIDWSGAGITDPPEGMSVELWRTTSNQAITLFRVAKKNADGEWIIGGPRDNLTDWELIDPDREGFQEMPILLPNGELNANRFGVPPTNYKVATMFQDRLWMAGDTEGGNQNVLRFSEMDEPESMPDVNELILQNNLRSTDFITALVPYAGVLVVMQARHSYRLQYVSQPVIDASISLLAYRGCLTQRTWDICNGSLYAMDDQGVYAMDENGQIEDLSLGIFNLWQDKIDFTKQKWFLVRVDKRHSLLRVSVSFKGDNGGDYPTRQLVYCFTYKCWWEERYPSELIGATEVRLPTGQVCLFYGTSSGLLRELGAGLTDIAEGGVAAITVTNPGRGYRKPPNITAPGGHGAEFDCGINSDGQVTGIRLRHCGTGYSSGNLIIDAPPEGGVQATATYIIFSGVRSIRWWYKTGCMEFTTDSQNKSAGSAQNRQVSVTYTPTQDSCRLYMQAYYNNAKYARSNVVLRDRGTGFTHSEVVPAAILDMQATPEQDAEAHGVARALFVGRTLDDMMGTDRHVSIELSGKQNDAGQVTIHNIDIYGVNEGQSGAQ